jgi:endoglucanase
MPMTSSSSGDETMFALVKALTELPGPIGHEQPVQDYLAQRWASRTRRVWQTPVGNLFAHVGGQGPRLLIGAHADEICFLVRSVSANGFIRLSIWNADREGRPPRWLFPIGQWTRIIGPGQPVNGIFATSTGHALNQAQREKPRLDWNDIFVDIGARSADEVERLGIRVGHRVIWNPSTHRLGESLITGKAMDDRAALAIMTALLDVIDPSNLAYDVTFVSTVMEETGLEGAHSIAREQAFDQAIALDVGLTGDLPSADLDDIPVRLGSGPTIVHQDSEIHYSRFVTDALIETAEHNDIRVQHAVFQNYASDGAAFIRQGIPTALIAFAARYTHSPFETIDERDLVACVQLLKAHLTASRINAPR